MNSSLTRILILMAVLVLPSCAYIISSQQQEITFNTIGAEDSVCYVYIERLRYKVSPPNALIVNKSEEDMTVDCLAPGQRRKKVTIPAMIEETTLLNVANGGLGIPGDFLSRSMFTYPDRIEVDFTDIPPKKQAPPQHNNPDTIQPEEYDLDEYGPSTPQLNSDRYMPAAEPLRRRSEDQTTGGYESYGEPYGPVGFSDKGDLMPVGSAPVTIIPASSGPQDLSGDNFAPIRPNAMANPGAAPAPVPSYPGE